MKASKLINNGFKSVTVFIDGDFQVATQDHPNFDKIWELVDSEQEEGLVDLFDLGKAVHNYFAKVSDLVWVENGVVYYDGTPIYSELTEHIIRLYESDSDAKAFIKFFEKLQSNPNSHSIDHLFRWVKDRNLTITDSGDIVAYKGLNSDFTSQHAGKGIVNGNKIEWGHLDNSVGNVVEMSREDVTFDPGVGCSFGLHAGTFDYAQWFSAGKIVAVHINPRDVVSVPVDEQDRKMRVTRYVVVEEVKNQYEENVVPSFQTYRSTVPHIVLNTNAALKKQPRDKYGRFMKKGN